MTPVIVIVVAAVVAVGLVVLVGRRRRPTDGVDSFRRQLGALSAEARRPVTGRLREHDGPAGRPTPPGPTGSRRPGDHRDGDRGA